MTTVTKQLSKKAVQRAGEKLIIENIALDDPELFRNSMEVLAQWRSQHENTLESMYLLLKEVSHSIDKHAIVAKRLKRAPSIISKLKRFEKMKLRNMQDIAGCRVITSSPKNMIKIKKELAKHCHFEVDNYLKVPKKDGYRGIHLISKHTNVLDGAQYPVEIQIRSKIQHAWATSVEIVDLFTHQNLKSDQGEQEWKDFFKIVSTAFAEQELRYTTSDYELVKQVYNKTKKLEVYKKFQLYRESLRHLDTLSLDLVKTKYILIKLKTKDKTIETQPYSADEFDKATQDYLDLEKIHTFKDSETVIALVYTDSLTNLKEAYPNYFADAELFTQELRKIDHSYRAYKQENSWILNEMKKSLNATGLNTLQNHCTHCGHVWTPRKEWKNSASPKCPKCKKTTVTTGGTGSLVVIAIILVFLLFISLRT